MKSHFSCIAVALSVMFFITTITSLPQELNKAKQNASGGNNDHRGRNNGIQDDDDNPSIDRPAITLVINDDRFTMSDFTRYDAKPLAYLERIERARIENAPLGYGCFFWSPIGSVMSSTQGITFVSKTFYSNSDEYMYFDFLANPEYLVCFKLPESEAHDDVVALWIESSSTDMDNLRTAMGFIRLSQHDKHVRSGSFLLPDWPSLDRAAIVHAFSPETTCIAGGGPKIVEDTGPLETILFSVEQPSVKRLLSPISVICYG